MAEEIVGALMVVAVMTFAALIGFAIGVGASILVAKAVSGLYVEPIAVSGVGVLSGSYIYLFISNSMPKDVQPEVWIICGSNSYRYGSITIYASGSYVYRIPAPSWATQGSCKAVLSFTQESISIPIL
ncbi:MAG: hypothetical protein QXI64_10430 [Sulfolobales archaeon]